MYDLIVIGSGPGGYVAAIHASQLGLRTALIEKHNLGGVCLNYGCIPTKSLLYNAKILKNIKNASKYGISTGDISFDYNSFIDRSREIVRKLHLGVSSLIAKNNIDLIYGTASINNKNNNIFDIGIAGNNDVDSLYAKNVILATGSSPVSLAGFENAWNYKNVLSERNLPKSILIIGAGAVGMEFAVLYNTIGIKVTVVEICDRILPLEDHEVSEYMKKEFEKDGMTIFTNSTAKNIDYNNVTICNKDGTSFTWSGDRILVSVGVKPNTNDIGLNNTAAILKKSGHFEVNAYMETAEKNLYAIGDIANFPYLGHKASHEGIIAAKHIAATASGNTNVCGDIHTINSHFIPTCTYTFPQVASIGITEQKAIELGLNVNIGKFPLFANGQSVISDSTTGFVKTIYDKSSGELLGAHIIGDCASELIGTYAVLMNSEGIDTTLINTIFPHPSVSESMHESTLMSVGFGIHY